MRARGNDYKSADRLLATLLAVGLALTTLVWSPPDAEAQTGPVVPLGLLHIDPEFNNGVDPKSDIAAGGFVPTPTGVWVDLYYDAVGSDLSNAKGACAYLQVDSGDTIRVCYDPDTDKTYKITNEDGAVELAPICSASTAPEVFGTHSDPWDNATLNTEGSSEWEDDAGGGTELDTIIQCNVPFDLLQDDDDPAVINVCTLQANTPSAWNTSAAKDCALRSATEGILMLNATVDGPDDPSAFTMSVIEPLSTQPLVTATAGAANGLELFGGTYGLTETMPANYSVTWNCVEATYDAGSLTVPPGAEAICTATFTYDSGVPPVLPGDLDSDGVADEYDVDDDNDGIVDSEEGATTNFQWAAWSSISGSTATGSAQGVDFTFTSSATLDSTPSMFGHSRFPAEYGVPNTTTIRNDYAGTNTLSFSEPVTDPLLAFGSVGAPSLPVSISFSAPIEVVWATARHDGSWHQDSPTMVTGAEGFMIIKVPGVYDSVGLEYHADEAYVNFAFGADFFVPFDTDGDGIVNPRDLDSDNDGITDFYESMLDEAVRALDTNNNGSLSVDEAPDTDGDGLMDIFEADLAEKLGTNPPDSDSDDTADFLDLDSDGDTIPDATEWQATAGYIQNDGDVSDEDSDGDGIADLFDLGNWFGGPIGFPVDTDGDSTDDYLDTNSDDDLDSDADEAGSITAPTYADTDGSISTAAASLPNEVGDTSEVAFREISPTSWTATASAGVTETDLSATFEYSFDITNTDGLPIVSLNAASPACQAAPTYDSGDTDSNGWLDVGETWTYTCTSTAVSRAQADAGTVDATVTFIGSPYVGSLTPATADTSVPVPAAPAVSVAVTTASVPTLAGQTLDYAIALTNDGNVSVTSPTVSGDSCAADPVYVAGDTDADSELDAGETWSFSCTSNPITQADVDAAEVEVAVTGSGTPVRGVMDGASATLSTPIAPFPGISLVKSALTAPAQADDEIEYSFTLVNTGNVTLSDPVFTDASCASAPTLQSESGGADNLLSPGETQTWTCTSVPVTQAQVDAGSIDSFAIVSATAAHGTDPGDAVDFTLPIAANPGWTLIKAAQNGVANAGESIDYTFSLVNTGNVTLNSIAVVDDKCAAAPTLDSESIDSDTKLQVGETQVWSCTSIPVTQAEVDAGSVLNEASADGLTPGGADPNDTTDSTTNHTTPIAAAPQWTLTTTPIGTPTGAGDTYSYSHELANTGNVTIEAVELAGSRCSSAPVLQSGDDGEDGLLAPGEVWTFTCPATPPSQAEVDQGSISHDAGATGAPARGELSPAEASAEITIAPTPSLSLVIASSSSPSIPGDTITYTYTVVNDGNVTIDDPAVTDPSCQSAPTLDSESSQADGSLSVGETQMWSCTSTPITDDHIAAGEVLSAATATGVPAGGILDPATDDYRIPIDATPSWSLVATDTDPDLTLDGTWIRTFTLVNTGNTSIGDISIVDPHCASPAALAEPAGATELGFGESQTWTCPTIPLTQTDIDTGIRSSEPVASGVASGGTLGDATTTIATVVPAQPSWQILKTATGAATAAGDVVGYELELVNTGNVTIGSIEVTDPKCAAEPVLDSETGPADGALSPAESQIWTCTSIPITQGEIDAGFAHNEATATGIAARGSLGEPITAGHDLSIVSDPRWTLVLSTPSTIDIAGDLLDLSFTVVNTGNVSIADPEISAGRCDGPAVPVGAPVNPLVPGAVATFECVSTPVTQAEVDQGFVDVAATATGTAAAGLLDDATASLRVDAAQSPSMSLTIAPLTTPTLGEPLPYSLALINTGNVTVTGIVVDAERCDAAAVLVAESAGADLELSPGEVWHLECDSPPVTQPEVDAGLVSTTADAAGTAAGASVTADDYHEAPLAQNPGWSLIVSTDSIVSEPGDTITYDYQVVNTGNVTIDHASISDPSCAAAPSPADLAAPLAPGERAYYTCESTPISVADIETGYVDDAATLTGSWVGGPMPADSGSVRVHIVAEPGLDATLAALNTAGAAGDQVTYEITVVNTGNVTLTTVDVTSPSCVASPVPVVAPGQPLAPGEVGRYRCDSLPVTQEQVDAGFLDGTALVEAEPAVGAVEAVPLSISLPITAEPSMTVVLAASVSEAPVPGSFWYTFTLVNDGNVTLHEPTLTPSHCDSPAVLTHESVDGDGTLQVGETQIWTCPAQDPTVAEANAGQIDATVSAVASSFRETPTEAHDTTTVLVPAVAAWSIAINTESVPALDHPVTYRVELANDGNVSVADPVVSVAECAGVPQFEAGDPDSNAMLDPGEVWIYWCDSHPVSQQQVDSGSISATAEATGEAVRSTVVPVSDQITLDIVAEPALEAAKTSTSIPGRAGDVLLYEFVIVNTGTVTLADVSIDDASCADGPFPADADAGPVPPGETRIWTCTSIPVAQQDVEAGQVESSGLVSAAPAAGELEPVPVELVIPIAADPGIELVATAGPAPISVGGAIDYSFTVVNTGNVILDPVVLDSGLCGSAPELISSSIEPDGPVDSQLWPGETWVLVCASPPLTQADFDGGSVAGSATASGEVHSVSGSSVSDQGHLETLLAQNPSLTIAAVADPVVAYPSTPVPFTVTVTNTGNVTLSAVALEAIADGEVECQVDPDAPPPSSTGSLAPGESTAYVCTVIVTQTDIAAGEVGVQLDSGGMDPNGDDVVAATRIGFPVELPDEDPRIGAALSVAVAPLDDGSVDVDFSILVENLGNVALFDLDVRKDLIEVFGADPFTLGPVGSWVRSAGQAAIAAVVAQGRAAGSACEVNPAYDGVHETSLLGAGGQLEPGDACMIELTVNLVPSKNAAYSSQVDATGTSPAGATTTDLSVAGESTDPGGDGYADESSPSEFVVSVPSPEPIPPVMRAPNPPAPGAGSDTAAGSDSSASVGEPAGPNTDPIPVLAYTGSETGPPIRLGVSFLLAGIGFVFFGHGSARRRAPRS